MKRVLIAAGSIILFSTPSFAINLSVNVDTPILAANGKPMLTCAEFTTKGACQKLVGMKFKDAVAIALSKDDASFSPEQKIQAGALAISIEQAKGERVFTVDELAILKRQVDKFADPVTDARVRALIQPVSK